MKRTRVQLENEIARLNAEVARLNVRIAEIAEAATPEQRLADAEEQIRDLIGRLDAANKRAEPVLCATKLRRERYPGDYHAPQVPCGAPAMPICADHHRALLEEQQQAAAEARRRAVEAEVKLHRLASRVQEAEAARADVASACAEALRPTPGGSLSGQLAERYGP